MKTKRYRRSHAIGGRPWTAVMALEAEQAYAVLALDVAQRGGCEEVFSLACIWNAEELQHQILVGALTASKEERFFFLPVEDEDDLTLAIRPPEFIRRRA